jgi:RNA polymerase sigma-70 factor (ECF subfamily)
MPGIEAQLAPGLMTGLELCRLRSESLEQTEALDRFLAGIERRALRMAQISTGDADEAMDLIQDAMLKLVERYSTRTEEEWTPLFYRILQTRILDWHRRQKVRTRWRAWFGRTNEDDQEDFLQRIPDVTMPDPAKQTALKRAGIALDAALHKLPLRQQQAFLLRAWEELDVAETARVMGCSQGSVKTHYFRAVHALRQRLGEHWP